MTPSPLGRQRAAATLVRWLGPWAGVAVPPDVRRTSLVLGRTAPGAPPVRASLYEPASGRSLGAYLVSPGLHYAGPDDPRHDRFCRVLATAGFSVLSPFLHDFLGLRVAPAAIDELALGFRALRDLAAQRRLPRPGVFSISFGSLPALALGAHPEHGPEVGALVLFGGYAEFRAAIRFALSGRAYASDGARVSVPYDPSNAPAVFVNLATLLDVPGDRALLARAWVELCQRTWGRRETWPRARRLALAEPLAARLPAALRELFWIGTGLETGGEALLEAALARRPDAFAFAEAPRYAARVSAPVAVVHGRDDDVIPWPEAEKLHAALPHDVDKEVLLTGIYAHNRASVPGAGALAREVAALARVVYALVDGGTEGLGRLGRERAP
ncbi:MAG: hypothetical protein IT373_03000 [Polyangiaceae bacterium]|nr:hypothetical protein [Polyangiaceae bacterium]